MLRANKFIWLLIISLRPLFGTIQCRYAVTCTEFAHYQLKNYSFFSAIWEITKRFISCNPFV